jgi:hypothetical protein
MISARNALRRNQISPKRAKPPLHPVANDSIANFLGDSDAKALALICIAPIPDQQNEPRHRETLGPIRREEICAAGERDQADSFLRPRARRARMIERPPGVDIRRRKP